MTVHDAFMEILGLLSKARDFENDTVRSFCEVQKWRRRVDAVLAEHPEIDKPDARYDTPQRIQHRQDVDRMFR